MSAELLDAPAIEIVKPHQLEDYLKEVDYNKLQLNYMPSDFALAFITFIKMVNGAGGEENESPVIHLDMLDQIPNNTDNLFVAFRGSAKTSVLHEYMFLYIATYGEIPNFGEVDVGIYVSDTIDNGVKSMRQQLQYRHEKSDFLQYYVPEAKLTDVRWEFTNIANKKFCVRGFGAATGVRGFKEYGKRPTWCGQDDLMSDKNAESPTIIKDIRNVVYKAVRNAMHPKKRMIIWTGTPFNKKDPLYMAAGSLGWNTRVYPICEQFPCEEKDFVGAWEDRFPYAFVKKEYDKLLEDGEISAFNQELMLRIVSEEDRLVSESDIMWYRRSSIMQNRGNFNFYITTDFATSETQSSDFSVIIVWAYNSNGDWFLVDIMVERQLMDKNIDALFRFAQKYKPQQVGIEVSGQQKGFIRWIQREMITRNIWFTLASENNNGQPGLRPVTQKIQRFNIVVPWFIAKKMYFPEEMRRSREMQQLVNEITLATMEGFKSKNDDCADTVSQLAQLHPWKPSADSGLQKNKKDDLWDFDDDNEPVSAMQSYVV